MDILSILALVEKGLSVISMVIDAGKDAAPTIQVVKDLVTGAQAGTVTQASLDEVEAHLDAQITEFNEPI